MSEYTKQKNISRFKKPEIKIKNLVIVNQNPLTYVSRHANILKGKKKD